jgi:hypothetical protein
MVYRGLDRGYLILKRLRGDGIVVGIVVIRAMEAKGEGAACRIGAWSLQGGIEIVGRGTENI